MEMNKHLELDCPRNSSTWPGKSRIGLILENNSSDYIHFHNDLGLRIFAYLEDVDRWIEIGNRINYAGNDIILSPKKSGLRTSKILTLRPDLFVFPDVLISIPPKSIRVVVQGIIYLENEPTNESVVTYIDVDLGKVFDVPPCNPKTSEGPIRDFTNMDLLIDLSDMPEGWQPGGGPVDVTDEVLADLLNTTENSQAYMIEASEISFAAAEEYTPSSNTASFRVSLYWNPDCATFFYMMQYPEGILESPPEWEEPNISAKQSQLLCMPNLEPDPQECIWAAQYEEYIAVFRTWLVPGFMSPDDLGKVVQAIDARMVSYLGEPEP